MFAACVCHWSGNYVRAVQRIYDAATMQELEEVSLVHHSHHVNQGG
jgi:hypothetical protein